MSMSDIESKFDKLKEILLSFESVMLAFSGGVDSTFLLKVSKEVLGNSVVAVTAVSPLYPEYEIEQAVNTAAMFDVKHSYTKPYRPQTNGKIERFWKTLYNECILCQRTTLTKEQLQAELDGFMYRYNYQRQHGGLNYKTPLDKLNFIANLLPKY